MVDLYWKDYVLIKNDLFENFWESFLERRKGRRILFILGKGFDPRMCHIINIIYPLTRKYNVDFNCLLVEFHEGDDSPSLKHNKIVSGNEQKFYNIINNPDIINKKELIIWTGNGNEKRRVCSVNATKLLNSSDIEGYTDIILDISSLPHSIYYPLIGKLLNLIKKCNVDCNFHVAVAESQELDVAIKSVGLDEKAEYIHGFGNQSMFSEVDQNVPKVWFPVLGEGSRAKLEKFYELIEPDEICPILPFPSKNPRRSDDILKEYRQLLFDVWNIEIRNIIYADEQNPFQVYRHICNAVLRYNNALNPLRGAKYTVSAVSSKLLSLGALLAVYNLKEIGFNIGLANVDVYGYTFKENNTKSLNKKFELFNVWLYGNCYK